jgi:hypothetical protein
MAEGMPATTLRLQRMFLGQIGVQQSIKNLEKRHPGSRKMSIPIACFLSGSRT